MYLVPRPQKRPYRFHPELFRLLHDTVTLPVTDLYDLLMRKDSPVPEFESATSVKRAKRGYRRLSMTILVAEYNLIAAMAEREDRSPEQQALHMLRQLLKELHAEAIKAGYRTAEERRDFAYDGEAVQGGRDEPEGDDGRDPHGIELGSVTRTE